MLPNARIIDIRREPMACCVSNLKQLFARGQEFCYGIEEIARYYRTYLELMRHWNLILPGRVLRVNYEHLVEDLGASVRRILAHCGVEFDPACLAFHRSRHAINTPQFGTGAPADLPRGTFPVEPLRLLAQSVEGDVGRRNCSVP